MLKKQRFRCIIPTSLTHKRYTASQRYREIRYELNDGNWNIKRDNGKAVSKFRTKCDLKEAEAEDVSCLYAERVNGVQVYVVRS